MTEARACCDDPIFRTERLRYALINDGQPFITTGEGRAKLISLGKTNVRAISVGEELTVARKLGAGINLPNHYDMFESNSEDPHLFADNIEGGMILGFNEEYVF